MKLRIYLTQEHTNDGPVWVAVCPDLSLAAQYPSYYEAYRKLYNQCRDYLKEAKEDGSPVPRILSRRSLLRYYWIRFIGRGYAFSIWITESTK